MSMNDFFAQMRASANNQDPTSHFDYGELVAYDPTTHTGCFNLPQHIDDKTGVPLTTGFLQLGTLSTGPGYGVQFTPCLGAQALLCYTDSCGNMPVVVGFLSNDVETPPFTDGRTSGWQDVNGSSHTTTLDGPTPGDNAGGARSHGSKYTATTTAGGHSHVQDDVNQLVKLLSSGGHYSLYDDANKLLEHVSAGGHKTIYDDNGRVLKHVSSGGLQHVMDDANTEIASVATYVALGDRYANMIPGNNALTNAHLNTFESSMWTSRLNDLTALVTAMIAAGVPNAGTVLSHLATLAHITVPAGSLVTRIK